ncbi:MAG: RagB/SusD family nutrient uptake outer membrane protein [Bacteroidales bacterium]|nr:RagB/SusD family nutrient uptake outer membrane protein [Bacteroidales bacterium]MCF8390938.1 RagB/SusD family nutrient uptake outer membrane protein [Bacteroidales bacterium]
MNYKLLITITVLVFSLGCSEFLTEDLQGTYSNSTFYKTAEHALLATNACYEPLAFKSAENNIWVFGDVASDDATKGGNPGDQSDISFIENFETNPDNGFVLAIWEHCYNGISRTNEAIANIPNIDMDITLRNQYVAEAKFLRAYYYFQLVNIFGEIPLKTQPVETSEDLHVATSSVDIIYSQIETDLLSAKNSLPVTITAGNYGRASKGAAFGLLAKAYLYNANYEDALAYVDSLEALNLYGLMDVYRHNFMLAYENNKESIFEIQHLKDQDPFQGSSMNQWFAPALENGYYFDVPRQDFIDEFEVTAGGVVDPRLDYTVGRDGETWLNGEAFDPAWSPSGYIQKKHIQPLAEVGKSTKGDGDLNYTYMRYSDILLIKAEALNELNRGSEALVALNAVRTRARESYLYDEDLSLFGSIPADLLPAVVASSKGTIQQAIMHERRVELGFEFHRYFDLMRYGKAVAESALSYTSFNYDTKRYFPIPQSELDINLNINY